MRLTEKAGVTTRVPGLVLGLLLSAALAVPGPALAASAGGGCTRIDPRTGQCDAYGSSPGNSSPAPVDNGGGGDPAVCKDAAGTVVDCTSVLGTWSNAHQCYLSLADPQPPTSDPIWAGHTDGAIYTCYVKGPGARLGTQLIWPVWLPAAPPVDPAVLAQQVIASMQLRAITIGITPEPGKVGAVGLPTYLWVEQPGENTYGPITRSRTEGGVTVSATAAVRQITWTMGDGHSVTCDNAGTPYQDAFGGRPSPTCGYTYTRARDPYAVSATSHWVVTWAGGGQTGTVTLDLTANAQIRGGEIQVLVQ